ncbi:Phosphatidylinositol alpha-mannosyltransferase [Kribbella flavida DSM 17836]|uniref:Phosphatidylinositol alpha-mannosyltransferase n=1 Tax=Kribbella flavida (strain DSM 17836 / JCM 10339 / NBRC 14399) TaxID=479435 RepID=D2PKW1_KRIFD|nr:glycosyltransferase family 4 protein [Kribbella flavida]ADB32428.1 Phosphatidylinositol alpha-mannosyltransferase [Kribbella flavida DSM 17836]
MKIGIVCPYSLGTPGGVQNHVRDLAEALLARGHQVSVLAPVDDDHAPPYVVSAGHAVGVPYNGSVARVTFGPRTAARVRSWLADGDFDVVHVHEPTTPSASILALWAGDGPFVATFHTWQVRSRAMSAASGLLRPALEKIDARIAVSENARSMMVQHIGGEAVVIPNGLYVDRFAGRVRPQWRGADGTISFLGRMDEPRKGLGVLLAAVPALVTQRPSLTVLVAGAGQGDEARRSLPEFCRESVIFLGAVDDAARADMLASSDLFVAPHLGGESFGIVLLEAMATGAPVVASDLAAFRQVLDGGRLGELFTPGAANALASACLRLLASPEDRAKFRDAGLIAARRYDWSVLTDEIVAVYEVVAR